MALGTSSSGGGIFSVPDRQELGALSWAQMSGVHPDSPLVGGRGTPTGGIDPDYKYRRVALSSPSQQPVGHRAHASELLNFGGSPMPWILLIALGYLGIIHLHAGGRLGPASASARVGK